MFVRIDDRRVELRPANRNPAHRRGVDETNHDVGDLRDRTGKLEGVLTALIGNQTESDAA